MKQTSVLVFGVGQVGLEAARQLLGSDYRIAGVYSRNAHIGADLGFCVGTTACGISVRSIDEFDSAVTRADVALFFTTGSLYDLMDTPRSCLENGINVVTIAEGATYPWTYDAALCKALDAAGRRGGASLTSTGMTDTYMVHLPAVLASSVPGVRRIAVQTTGDFGRLGACALSAMPLGLSKAAFENMLGATPSADTPAPPSIGGQCLEAMASLMGMTAGEIATGIDVILAQQQIRIATTGQLIEPGTISGLLETVSTTTAEGVELSISLRAEIFARPGAEMQRISIETVHGVRQELETGPTPGVEYTAAIAINRIRDIIAAPPGLQTIDRLPAPLFRPSNSPTGPGISK